MDALGSGWLGEAWAVWLLLEGAIGGRYRESETGERVRLDDRLPFVAGSSFRWLARALSVSSFSLTVTSLDSLLPSLLSLSLAGGAFEGVGRDWLELD